MKVQRILNVKQMLDAYLSCDDEVQAENLWNSFVVMRDFGFISFDAWNRFYDMVHDAWFSRE